MMELRLIYGHVVWFFLFLWLVICLLKSQTLWPCTKRYSRVVYIYLHSVFSKISVSNIFFSSILLYCYFVILSFLVCQVYFMCLRSFFCNQGFKRASLSFPRLELARLVRNFLSLSLAWDWLIYYIIYILVFEFVYL